MVSSRFAENNAQVEKNNQVLHFKIPKFIDFWLGTGILAGE
jgi:hypothetical protein